MHDAPARKQDTPPMSIRFAAPRQAIRNRMEDTAEALACRRPANDNGPAAQLAEATLQAALRHFAQHGLAAARHARQEAESARAQGDERSFAWWRDICRALDRRLAREIDQQAI